MAGNYIYIILAVGSLAVVGCSDPGTAPAMAEVSPDARICQPIPDQGEGQWGACIHRIAYKFAHAHDPAEVVAKAVASSCGDRIAEQINAAAPNERADLAKAIMGSVDRLALAKVIEARAGRCEVPE